VTRDAGGWIASAPDGAVLRVRVSPRAGRSALAGLRGDALRVRVAAPPVEGAANRELVRFLAAALGIAPGSVAIEAGTHGREKRVRVRGISAADVRARLAPSVDRATDGT
jgi:uncharacterized protein (TIGR00251 family)